jgi:hypothetical protein
VSLLAGDAGVDYSLTLCCYGPFSHSMQPLLIAAARTAVDARVR